MWDLASGGRLLNTLEGHTSGVSSIAITTDNTKIVSVSSDHIKMWDLNNGSIISDCKFDSPITSIAISKNKNIMTIEDFNGGVYAINIM